MAILHEEEMTKKRPEFNFSNKSIKGFEKPDNFKAALDFLQTKTPEDITKLKGSRSEKSTEAKDDLYLSLYLANKALAKEDPRAEKILNKLKAYPKDEINTNFHGRIANDLRKRWDQIKTGRAAQNTKDDMLAPLKGKAPKQEPATPTPQPAVKEVEPTKPETSSGTTASTSKTAEGDVKTSPDATAEKEEEPKAEQHKIDLTKPVAPAMAVERIQKLKAQTSDEIKKIIGQLEKSEDLTAKLSLSKVLAVKKHYERKMARYEKNANAGPYSARKALNWAETDSGIAKHTAFKHTLKGTFRRGIQRMGDTAESMGQRINRTGQAIKKGYESNETLAKVKQNIKPAMEKARSTTEAGVERVGQRYQGRVQKQRAFIKQFAPEYLDSFNKAGPVGGEVYYRMAINKRNQAMKQQPPQQPPQTPQQPIITPQQPQALGQYGTIPGYQAQPRKLTNKRAGQKQLTASSFQLNLKRKAMMNYLNS